MSTPPAYITLHSVNKDKALRKSTQRFLFSDILRLVLACQPVRFSLWDIFPLATSWKVAEQLTSSW
jgi:hypothetical protein